MDTEIYEAVVSQPLVEPQVSSDIFTRHSFPFPPASDPPVVFVDPQPGERHYLGQVHVDIGPLRTNLPFDRKDSTVTLLKNDQVLINLLTDIVTEKRRATNIKPQIPATFSLTKETRETVRAARLPVSTLVFLNCL